MSDEVEVVEVIAAPYSVTEVVGGDPATGLVEVQDVDATLIDISPIVEVVAIATPEMVGPPGPQGPQGVEGPQGVQGPQGERGPLAPTIEQHFAAPQLVWTIVHNLDAFPVVTTFDLNGQEIVGDVTLPDRNTVVVTFAVAMAGTARLKA